MGLFDIFGTSDQDQAAGQQIQGIQSGLSSLNNYYGQGQSALNTNYAEGLAPFQQNYGQSNAGTTQLGNVLGLNGQPGSAAAMQTLQATPGYQFQTQQGNNAVNAAEAAGGNLNSGKQQTDLSQFNQGLAGTTYNNYVSQLQPYLGYSSSSAAGIGGLSSGLGNQLSSLLQSQGNANYGGDASIGNAEANASLSGLNASANGLGALMGGANALFGFLSDERTKDDIEPVGELYDGQPVYRFKYKGDHRHQIGLLAQDVEAVEPDAVFDMTPDYKGVDYKRATDYAASLVRFGESPEAETPANYGSTLLKMAA